MYDDWDDLRSTRLMTPTVILLLTWHKLVEIPQ